MTNKPQGLMSAEAFQETKEALDDFATWWVNNYAPDVVDVVVEEHIPRLLAHIAAQDAIIAELQEESDYQSHAIEVLVAALPHDAARQLLTEEE